MVNRISLKEAIKFHGHLGPYLVLGIRAGETALKKFGNKKYFGLEVKAWGATKKPKSCLIDGLQLSTGATYGKGNIQKIKGSRIKILLRNLENNKRIKICLKKDLVDKLAGLKGHRDSEILAKELYKINPLKIFNLMVQPGR
ncbi:MAG: formylmethanofuran dehydrogenase subunit E family protein [Candidatus Omnitrophica bacterium]|nr:formylmethanofuran dehydrogenase subunit E family protein [Candidatus Omnitrophota bacterium]